MKTAYYLMFDGGCSTCSTLASSIEEEAGGKVSAVRSNSERGYELLGRAFPHGHKWQPYLIAVNGETLTAMSGLKMIARLGWLLGPRRAIRVCTMIRQLGVKLPSSREGGPAGILPLSRRAFVKLTGTMMAIAVVPLSPPHIPEARTWKCYAKGYMRGNSCCAGIPVTGYGEDINQVNACNAAKRDANNQASLQGCYAGHLQCQCSQ